MEWASEIAAWMDRLAIQELAIRYCDAVTRGDWDAFEAVWMPDAIWEETVPMEARIVGRRAIRAHVDPSVDHVDFFVQICHGVTIDELGRDRAQARTTIHGVARAHGQSCVNHAIYYDTLVKSDGVWRYAHRRLQNIYVDTSPLPGTTATARIAIL
jgi:hypothetical protein